MENELMGKLIVQRIHEKQEEERLKNAVMMEGKAGRIKIA